HLYYFGNVFGPDLPIRTILWVPTEFRGYATRHDVTHPHVLTPHVLHHRFGETRQAKLRSVISSPTSECMSTCQTTYIDDVPCTFCFKPEQRFTAAVKSPEQIRFYRSLPLLHR